MICWGWLASRFIRCGRWWWCAGLSPTPSCNESKKWTSIFCFAAKSLWSSARSYAFSLRWSSYRADTNYIRCEVLLRTLPGFLWPLQRISFCLLPRRLALGLAGTPPRLYPPSLIRIRCRIFLGKSGGFGTKVWQFRWKWTEVVICRESSRLARPTCLTIFCSWCSEPARIAELGGQKWIDGRKCHGQATTWIAHWT